MVKFASFLYVYCDAEVFTQASTFLTCCPKLSCVCKTTVADNVAFTGTVNIFKEAVMSQLFMGALGPQDGGTAITVGDGLTAHILGCNVGGNTVFKVQDKGRTLYLKNILSTVGLEGWTMSPQIHEAEDAIFQTM